MITARIHVAIWGILALLLSAAPVGAQSREGSSREGSSREGSSRYDPRESVKRMDTNHDGQIDPKEVPLHMRKYVDRAAHEAGLNLEQPISVEQLGEAMAKRSSERRSSESGSSSDRERSDGDRNRDSRSSESRGDSGSMREGGERSSSSGSSKSASLVPGFGEDPKLAKPPGFDVKPDYLKGERSSAGSSAGFGSSSGSGSSGSGSSDRGKLRRYAESLMKQYDTNSNGVLDKNEWEKMSGSPKKADGNNDETLTLDELTDHVARLSGVAPETSVASTGGSSSPPSGGSWNRDRGDDRSRSSSSEAKVATRFLTPTERLPKGLPDWFVRNDADGDGQIAMSEFTTAWSNDKAGEFIKYDRDGDGMVTPAECLLVEKERKR